MRGRPHTLKCTPCYRRWKLGHRDVDPHIHLFRTGRRRGDKYEVVHHQLRAGGGVVCDHRFWTTHPSAPKRPLFDPKTGRFDPTGEVAP